MGDGPSSDWYQNANQAPWTPPGWVFGAAWFTIMICFSIYMVFITEKPDKRSINLYILLTLLNISWNPLFFWLHEITIALIVIVLLTIMVGAYMLMNWKPLGWRSILILPYFIWLCIASSLNGFFLFNNA